MEVRILFDRVHTDTDLSYITGLFIINGGRNSYDPVEILAKKLRKLNETNILVGPSLLFRQVQKNSLRILFWM